MTPCSGTYAGNLATLATRRRGIVRDDDPNASIERLLEVLVLAGHILARVAEATPPGGRGYHAMGMADATGFFLAMGCDETLVHSDDICAGLGVRFDPAWRPLRPRGSPAVPVGARARRPLAAPAVVQRPHRAPRLPAPRAAVGPVVRAAGGVGRDRLHRRPAQQLTTTPLFATVSGRELALLQVVLDLPAVVDAEPVGQLDLLQRVLEQPVLVVRPPRPRELVLVEDPESHPGS